MRAKHLIPNLVTLGNVGLGFFSILAAAEARYERAVVLLFLAALCDLADGRLARLLDACSRFGTELDSLSDAISFGIAPAVLIYFAVLKPLGAAGAAIAMTYTLCGVLRLARYNLTAQNTASIAFDGLPIPVAAGYLMSFVMVRQALPIWVVAAGTLGAAGVMVSTIKIPKFRRGGLPSVLLYIGIATFVAFLARPSALTWHVWNGWNLLLIVANYVLLWRREGEDLDGDETARLRRAA